MDDFRSQLGTVIEEMREAGVNPVFLLIDLEGAEQIRVTRDAQSLEDFKAAAVRCVVSATDGADAFTYGEDRVIAILGEEFDRLRTFALVDKLRRTMPFVGQSFDCVLRPSFDVIEYDEATGVGGLIKRFSAPRITDEELTG